MKTITAETLTAESFKEFGSFENLINPTTEKFGAEPIEFYRDMVQQDLGGAAIPSYSICRVLQRDLIIDVSEYHTGCGEGILPIDNDVLIHVAPATADATLPLEAMRAFRVPKGTMVTLKPGVWHHAPFSIDGKVANVLIVLPVRTYANDCIVVEHQDDEKIQINL